jgi:hypothetical protein
MEDRERTSSKVDLRNPDKKIIFSICNCSLKKRFSFFNLKRKEAELMINRLKYLERMTWRTISGLTRRDGLTREKVGTKSFKMIEEQDSSEDKIAEQYYFHFRVEKVGKFRIFGYQKQQLFFITHIDPEGKIHHK